jgi:predicted HAD superfamily Cof-like phosphohydrolase
MVLKGTNMSKSWSDDIWHMHEHYGFHVAMNGMDEETRAKYLEFRVKFLEEELTELRDNIANPEEVVDALIDLCVVAIGTLDAFGIRSGEAWDEVLRANMDKEVGVKETRPNPGNFPDLVKPVDWKAPSHAGNHGCLPTIMAPEEPKKKTKKVA